MPFADAFKKVLRVRQFRSIGNAQIHSRFGRHYHANHIGVFGAVAIPNNPRLDINLLYNARNHLEDISASCQSQISHFWGEVSQKVSHGFAGNNIVHSCRIFHGVHHYFEDRQNWFPSWSWNIAAVPQASVLGSITNSTPLLFNNRAVAWTSSLQNVTGCCFPSWLSCPSAEKSTSLESLPGIPISIHRCLSSNGWSVRTRKPSFSV